MLLDGLNALMSGYAPLTNVVGSQMYLVMLPATYSAPALTYYLVSNRTEVALDKTATSMDTVDINVWAANYHDAALGRQALHALLDGYQGTLSDGTVILYTASQDNPDQYELDTRLYRCSTSFTFTH